VGESHHCQRAFFAATQIAMWFQREPNRRAYSSAGSPHLSARRTLLFCSRSSLASRIRLARTLITRSALKATLFRSATCRAILEAERGSPDSRRMAKHSFVWPGRRGEARPDTASTLRSHVGPKTGKPAGIGPAG
jgi:hypothetical protein